ncbi:response regulator transcription factor [Hymenobacter rubidus]|uniref:response regulator transcription factor n=1 Tax=Hymenobacter rubidus TaxID=1441626 RepID=UPI00191CF528|nr:LuxR C-terminal-related transcriptional regulator [Hymenobacter rubidus]
MTDQELIAHRIDEVAATADYHPGVVVILNNDARQVLYMSQRGLRQLHTTIPELTAMGEEYYARYFNPDEAQEYVPKVVELLTRNDPDYSVSFFQQVRTGPNGGFELHLSTARVLAQGRDGQPLLVICLSCAIDRDSHINTKVQRLLDENAFLRSHAARFSSLSTRERQVLAHLSRGQSSAEIAEALHISIQTVDTHRRNLRQKLGVVSGFELGQYARAFDLI